MLYVKSETGELIPITYEGVFAKCPGCGAVHQVDISEIMESCGGDVEDANVYCVGCSKRHLPMWENMDQIEFLASQFPDCRAANCRKRKQRNKKEEERG